MVSCHMVAPSPPSPHPTNGYGLGIGRNLEQCFQAAGSMFGTPISPPSLARGFPPTNQPPPSPASTQSLAPAPSLTTANHLIEGHSTESPMPTNSTMQPHRGSTPQHVLIKPRLTTANGTPSPSPSAASEPPAKKRRGRPPKVQSYDRLGPGRPRLLALAPQPPPSATAQQQAFAAVPQSIDTRSRRTASPAYTVSPGPNIENIAPSRGLKRSLPDRDEQTQPAHLHPRFIPPDESGLPHQRANASGAPTPATQGTSAIPQQETAGSGSQWTLRPDEDRGNRLKTPTQQTAAPSPVIPSPTTPQTRQGPSPLDATRATPVKT